MAKKKNTLRNILISAGILIVVLTILKSTGIIGDDNSIKVSAEEAAVRTILETVSASGKIQPEVEVKISADVSGEIVELPVKVSQQVKKGDLLCRINPEIYVSNLDRMIASVNSSKANLESSRQRLQQALSQFEKTELNFNRNKKLFAEKVISASEFEAIKSSYEVSKAETESARQGVKAAEYGINSAEAALKEARENLNKTTIYAPVDGTISKLNVTRGERVQGVTGFQGTELMRIANLNEMEVQADVSESDIIRVKLNDTTIVEVDAYRDKKFKGIVTEIANSAAMTSQVATDQVTNYPVKIRVLRESYEDLLQQQTTPFRPGMSATVEIQTKRVGNVITVPIQSVTMRDTSETGKNKKKLETESESTTTNETPETKDKRIECIFVIEKDHVRLQPVKSGIQDNTYIEIKTGLKEKEKVVTGPFNVINKKLENGDKVKVVEKEKLFEQQ
ncbi:MAG: efflux RND transporter periplasmic adaptor subunit [Bacteroidia bacterium]|nr:efflux RND transporter periplasmic adaptor subunit [Bacteroidia bacterium]